MRANWFCIDQLALFLCIFRTMEVSLMLRPTLLPSGSAGFGWQSFGLLILSCKCQGLFYSIRPLNHWIKGHPKCLPLEGAGAPGKQSGGWMVIKNLLKFSSISRKNVVLIPRKTAITKWSTIEEDWKMNITCHEENGYLYYFPSKPLNLRASFPLWHRFVPVNVAMLRLPPLSFARTKNPSRIFQRFRRQIV